MATHECHMSLFIIKHYGVFFVHDASGANILLEKVKVT